jgi:parvulin-like peptidyl-prolyl isomerase
MIAAKHILVDKSFEAEDILKKLADGAEFETLAKDFSNCGSASQGGDLGEFSKGMMVKPFEDAVLNLKVGETSGIVKTQFGHHIILRTK